MAKREWWPRVGDFFMEVEGNHSVVLSGCRGICTYTEECIALRTSFGMVAVYGQEMEMGCMTAEGATVIGKIQRIEFGEEDGQ